MARLLHDRKFLNLIKCVHVDEVHNVYTSGTQKHGHPAFCLAWGSLSEVRAILSKTTSWQALSATMPSHIFKCVTEKLFLASNRLVIRVSTNCPNIIYATHPLVGSINNFRNLDCLVPRPFHPPMRLQKVIVFHDNKTEANNAARYLNSRLPAEFQKLGIIKHYHGDMSEEYLEKTYTDFANPDGFTLMINGTSGAGTVRHTLIIKV